VPELVTPEGAPVEVTPEEKREQINQDFSRAMASEEPSATPALPERPARPEPPKKRGRPSKDEKARATSAPPVSQKTDKDFSEECTGLTTLAWASLAMTPFTQPYAAVVDANQAQLVAALNGAAQNNAKAREAIEKLAGGGGGIWAVQLAAVGANMTMQTMQLLKDPQLRQEAAAATQSKFRTFLKAQGVDVPDDGQGKPAEVPSAPASA
jgi:hypothetical protein